MLSHNSGSVKFPARSVNKENRPSVINRASQSSLGLESGSDSLLSVSRRVCRGLRIRKVNACVDAEHPHTGFRRMMQSKYGH